MDRLFIYIFQGEYFMLDFLARELGGLHPPATHFPIVCSLLALLAFTVGHLMKKEWLLKSSSALWILTFLTAVPSVMLGHLFAHHLGLASQWSWLPPESALKGQLRLHALLGTAGLGLSLGTFWGAVLLARGKSWPFFLQLILGLAAAVLFGVAGHEGGEMVYGSEDSPSSTAVSMAPPAARTLLDQTLGYSTRLVKMNTRPWLSRTHGNRWVNTYVSKEAVPAYKNSNPLPVGSFVVKESFEGVGGQPSTVSGPLYVMRKGTLSDSPQTGGWQYAFQWDRPVAGNPEKISGPVTWLPGDPALHSCLQCHNHFHGMDYMGGVPSEVSIP
jgi:uncharacterized membrane protein